MTVTYEATGSGGNITLLSDVTTIDTSWSHTAGGGEMNVVVLFGSFYIAAGYNTWTITATYGGTPMTLLSSLANSTNAAWGSFAFYLMDPPTGAQTVIASASGALGKPRLEGNSVSYNNAFTPSATAASSSSSTSSITVASGAGSMVCATQQCWGSASFSSIDGTQRGSTLYNGVARFAVHDTAGDSSVTLTGTMSASAGWNSIGVNIPAQRSQDFFAFFT